jgi:hypothetical protein
VAQIERAGVSTDLIWGEKREEKKELYVKEMKEGKD